MKKSYLYGMIVIVIISFCLCAYGTTMHFLGKDTNKDNNKINNSNASNPKTSDGKVDSYSCKESDCKLLDGTRKINNQYEFIQDGNNTVVLYDAKENKVVAEYLYAEQGGSLYIAKDSSGKYGLVDVDKTVKNVMDFDYSSIKYNNNNGEDQYMVTSDKGSYIANKTGEAVSKMYSAQIIEYNDRYIITKGDEYHIFNFNNKEFLSEYINTGRLFIQLVGDYVGVITTDYVYCIYDFSTGSKIIGEYQLQHGQDNARARYVDNKIEIYDDEKVLKTIDL